MTNNSDTTYHAVYHPVLKTYLYLYVTGLLFISAIGIPLIPIWLIIGNYFCNKYFKNLECILTPKTLELKKGYLFRVEKTIPLDKIQDLTLRDGPLLRALNICKLEIETAGQSNPQGTSDAKIIGVIEAKEFRDRVLSQRDLLLSPENKAHSNQKLENNEPSSDVLVEIRDTLINIKTLLEKNK